MKGPARSSRGLQSIPPKRSHHSDAQDGHSHVSQDDNDQRLEEKAPPDVTTTFFDNSSKYSELTPEEVDSGRMFFFDDSIKGTIGISSNNNAQPQRNVSDITVNDCLSAIQTIRNNLDDDDTQFTGGGCNCSSTAATTSGGRGHRGGNRKQSTKAASRITGGALISPATTMETAKRRVNSLRDVTMNQLKFDTLGLKGRDSELHRLNQALDSICPPSSQQQQKDSCIEGVESTRKTETTTTNKKQFVTISGASGTGKSVLATSIGPKVTKMNGIIAEGKFDLQHRSVPYSGIAEVGNSICGQIYAQQFISSRANNNDEDDDGNKVNKFAIIQKQLVKELGTDLKVLSRLIPALMEIVETDEEPKEQQNYGGNNDKDMDFTKKKPSSLDINDRFQLVFRKFSPSTSPTVNEQECHDEQEQEEEEEPASEVVVVVVDESNRNKKSMNSLSRRVKLEEKTRSSLFGRTRSSLFGPTRSSLFGLSFRHNKRRSPSAFNPSTNKIMKEGPKTKDEDAASGDDNEFQRNSIRMIHRFQDAFRRFLRIVTRYFTPLVLILDDLQWSDLSSLDLLEAILTDRRGSNLLVIGVYRSNEVDQHHSLARVLRELKARSSNNATADKEFTVQEIEIRSLSLEAINEVIQHVLDEPNETKTKGLAELCYKRTSGNAFFLRQFLNMLKDQNLLRFTFGLFSWSWDLEEIDLQTEASANVVDILTTKMRDLSSESQSVIQLASCLGTTFQGRILLIVWKPYCENYSTTLGPSGPQQEADLQVILNSLVQAGYFEENNNSSTRTPSTCKHQQHALLSEYCFAHDKVREAAYSLVSDTERATMHRRVGEILVSRLNHDDLEDVLFVAVDLLNQGTPSSSFSSSISTHASLSRDEERINLAYLNCRAGQKAVSFSAFEAAADFASKGISLLPRNETAKWEGHRNLTLKLYAIGTKAEAFLGNADQVDRYSYEVISQKTLSMVEKLDVYTLWIDNLAYRGDLRDASKVGLDVLSKMGCKFPKSGNKFGLLLNLALGVIGLKGLLKHNELEQFQNMPIDHDPIRLKLIVIMNVLATVLYQRAKKQ